MSSLMRFQCGEEWEREGGDVTVWIHSPRTNPTRPLHSLPYASHVPERVMRAYTYSAVHAISAAVLRFIGKRYPLVLAWPC